MRALEGKNGLVFGIANDHSIAWSITQMLRDAGAEMGFTHLPDKDPDRPRMERRVRQLVEPFARFILPCDVQNDDDLDAVFSTARDEFRQIHFVLHSIAYARIADLRGPTLEASRDGFKTAMDISVYSLMAIAKRARMLLAPGGSILTLTYLGGERVIPGYNMMGVCKAALEQSVAYLASELGPADIRINALSAGPVKTLSASAVGDFDQMLELYDSMSPMRKNIMAEDVGRTGMDGDTFRRLLMDRFDIQINKTSRNSVLFMVHIGTTRGAIAYLIEVLTRIAQELEEKLEEMNPVERRRHVHPARTRRLHEHNKA